MLSLTQQILKSEARMMFIKCLLVADLRLAWIGTSCGSMTCENLRLRLDSVFRFQPC